MSGADGKKPKYRGDESTLVGLAEPVSQLFLSLRMARLEQVKGPGAPRELILEREEMVIGRSEDADLPVASPLISRRHAVFRKRAGQVRCVDLNSANGMYLNGTRAHGADLYEGDTIQIGDVVLVFHEGQ